MKKRNPVGQIILALFVFSIVGLVEARDISDRQITGAVERELLLDDAVSANRIDVKTHEGIVTFSGNVENILAKERAEELASALVGVRAVVNRLNVVPAPPRSDEDVATDVRLALLDDPVAEAYELQVSVEDGVVELTGSVESYAEKQFSEIVAKGVDGVRDVNNRITLVYEDDRPDQEIKAEIDTRLQNDVRVDDSLISIKVDNGNAVLSGSVGSLQEKNQVLYDAWVAGVRSVDLSDLHVTWWIRDEMKRDFTAERPSDQEIRMAVKDAFFYDPRIYSFKPSVEVADGVVTLSGMVSGARAKLAAEQDARNTFGVRRVYNNLKVRTLIPGDDELKARIGKVLLRNPYIDRFDLTVEADFGRVTLSGMVQTSFEKYEAERVVLPVDGVTEVVNNIGYRTRWIWKPDRELREEVRDQLFWSAFVDSDDIQVSVNNGIVTLTGTVSSWSEYDDAEKNTYQAGAKSVENKLVVTHSDFDYHGPSGPFHYGGYGDAYGYIGYGYGYPYGW